MTTLDATKLYRLPWTLADNGISWLEPTVLCNLQCDGCYRRQEEDPRFQRAADRHEIHGYLGPRFVEAATNTYHLLKGRYLSYVSPGETRHGRAAMFLAGFFDQDGRHAWRTFLGRALRDPRKLFRRIHLQSLMFIQPVNFMDSGEQSMCDGCPDITVHDGKLAWSCRLDDLKQYGSFLRTFPRGGDCKAGAEAEA